ncbi:MAG: MBL fold metallo-hydrolase [Dehalococcoidia bacterium]|nr:MBL fold metallo-hydrolase [Dehalococcoidia bacterium]
MAREEEIRLIKYLMGPYDNNCYILIFPETMESIIVDAPSEPDTIMNAVMDTRVKRIVITHSHQDHWGALQAVKERTGAPVSFHVSEEAAIGIRPDLPLGDDNVSGETISLGPAQIKVIQTPGHTPGSICLLFGRNLITGDTLFPGGPGHTRTPQALQQTIDSITRKLLVLPDDIQVWPGHGAEGILRQSKQEYAVFAGKSHDPGLCGDVVWLES